MRKTLFAALLAMLSSSSISAAVGDKFTADGLTFTVVSEDPAEVSVKATDPKTLSGDVVIPSTIVNNDITYSVTIVEKDAFNKCQLMESITLPSTIDSIGTTAFYNCPLLKELAIPASVKRIGTGVASYCISLSQIKVDPANETYCDVDGVLFNKAKTQLWLFPGNSPLNDYVVPEGVDSLMKNAFLDCRSITSLTLSNTVTFIGDCAVYTCPQLKSLYIPASVTEIEPGGAGGRCASLETIEVDDANENYCSVDGILFNKDKNIIMQYPACRGDVSFVIPETVDSINPYCFANSVELTSITISDKIDRLSNYAFFQCTKINRIVDHKATPQALGTQSLYRIPTTAVLYVPKGSVDAYSKATTWKNFKNIREIGAMMVTLDTRVDTLAVGATLNLKAEIEKYEDVSVKSEEWTSSNPDVATVDSNGVVTAIADGNATITVTVTDENDATCTDVCAVTVDSTAGITIITTDGKGSIDYSAPYEVFAISGMWVGNRLDSLTPGLYIVRQKAASAKILVK